MRFRETTLLTRCKREGRERRLRTRFCETQEEKGEEKRERER
ncbi:unnamed protein product [Spirodela intermedia]|uniref:Uncharacterized protein n=1 Tax=Spirodela intermedia TaxID=51605 RepID=A0A7I8JES2_SPIIN|nr:unnamed protein product [Spirodela intermedia]CAA6668255.1 unnamed protein product [Spirodela intermedia]